MDTLSYQTPPAKPKFDLRAGNWQIPLSFILAMGSIPLHVAFTVSTIDLMGYGSPALRKSVYQSSRPAYLIARIPVGLLLVLSFELLFLTMSRRPRFTAGKFFALMLNLGAVIVIATGIPS